MTKAFPIKIEMIPKQKNQVFQIEAYPCHQISKTALEQCSCKHFALEDRNPSWNNNKMKHSLGFLDYNPPQEW